jgi:hypothetical protein
MCHIWAHAVGFPIRRSLDAASAFVPQNYDNRSDKFAFDAIRNKNFRYMANTILNAGYVQFDNKLSDVLRAVWGLRVTWPWLRNRSTSRAS